MSRRIRRTPYTGRVEACGASGFTVVNHMLLPKAFRSSVEEDYWHLREHVQIWDVACERQVEISGKNAFDLVQMLTPRDVSRSRFGKCLYIPATDANAGMINDPILLRLTEDRFWLSTADSDLLLFVLGLAAGSGMSATVTEPDVSPLAVQGPKSEDLMASVFGAAVRRLRFFDFALLDFQGTRQVIARTGYSGQDGFEIFLDRGDLGPALWDALWEAGKPLGVRAGSPNLIDRIEAGLLSYGNEMTRANNPLECGFEKYCALDGSIDFLGLAALQEIARQGVARRIMGLVFEGESCPTCMDPWPVKADDGTGTRVGQVTSAAYSPRRGCNVGLAMIDRACWTPGQSVAVVACDGISRKGNVAGLPFE